MDGCSGGCGVLVRVVVGVLVGVVILVAHSLVIQSTNHEARLY